MEKKQLFIKGFWVGLGFAMAFHLVGLVYKLLPMVTGFVTLALTK